MAIPGRDFVAQILGREPTLDELKLLQPFNQVSGITTARQIRHALAGEPFDVNDVVSGLDQSGRLTQESQNAAILQALTMDDPASLPPGVEEGGVETLRPRTNVLENIIRTGGVGRQLPLDVLTQVEQQLDRTIQPNEVDFVTSIIREGATLGLQPSEIARQITSDLQIRDIRTQGEQEQAKFQELFETEQERVQRQQNIINTFLGQGGILDEQAAAQLNLATTSDDANRIALESVARRANVLQQEEQQLTKGREELGGQLLQQGQLALREAAPFIREQLQRQRIPLESGALADILAERAAELELPRQQLLAGITVENLNRLAGMRDLFGQQARDIAFQQLSTPERRMQDLFGLRTGTAREDVLGGRQFEQELTGQALQNQAVAREQQRQRGFQQQLFNQALQEANRLADAQRRQSFIGTLSGLGGAALGGLTGALFPLPNVGRLGTSLFGAGLGETLGKGFSGFLGGVPSGGTSPFFNILDTTSQLFGRSSPGGRTTFAPQSGRGLNLFQPFGLRPRTNSFSAPPQIRF